MTAAEMTGSLLLWLGVRCPEDWGGEKSTVIAKRGIMLQPRGSEAFPGRVWAEKKVKDKHSSCRQPHIKGKTGSAGKGRRLRRIHSRTPSGGRDKKQW